MKYFIVVFILCLFFPVRSENVSDSITKVYLKKTVCPICVRMALKSEIMNQHTSIFDYSNDFNGDTLNTTPFICFTTVYMCSRGHHFEKTDCTFKKINKRNKRK
jgi:hypothetical protein